MIGLRLAVTAATLISSRTGSRVRHVVIKPINSWIPVPRSACFHNARHAFEPFYYFGILGEPERSGRRGRRVIFKSRHIAARQFYPFSYTKDQY